MLGKYTYIYIQSSPRINCFLGVEGNKSCLPLELLDYKGNDRTSFMGSSQIAKNIFSLKLKRSSIFLYTAILSVKKYKFTFSLIDIIICIETIPPDENET